ncbi:Nif3-like dinuclear metal center hexameric protein [Dendronalium sp. ChiSLP03b]|uniref:Nif3-like dinuclear metal center hexameric protein n=1 Tax=Dendronalium sp. ChiSLP03b TaxID=3075381 RepID=UPI002AD37CFD|nr:Nif3-like dinuclear metal center hexameric protein [Dendronalium sp. ChiSLP03b]MDZ8204333.1 Nif3-like dinuclear metal center hexameric protein [Dendronalium sp. ChiSLP03b]
MLSEYNNLILIEDIAEYLNCFLAVKQFAISERGGVYLPSLRPIKCLGLALEPGVELLEWVNTQNLDALFLHRPWKLKPELIPPDCGVISYHLPFDESLTVGFNPRLAQVLNMSQLEVLGEKENRAIGMLGKIPTQSFVQLCSCITQVFGGHEQICTSIHTNVSSIAVVGAITEKLVYEAVARGVEVYITGQLRQPAVEAIQKTKIGVIAVGHRRSESWGLRTLAGVLQERWFNLKVVVSNN